MSGKIPSLILEKIKRLNLATNAIVQFADTPKLEFDWGSGKINWLGVKDNIMVKGMQLSAGSRILDGIDVNENATCVQMLVDAGYKVLGKTNMDEFGMG